MQMRREKREECIAKLHCLRVISQMTARHANNTFGYEQKIFLSQSEYHIPLVRKDWCNCDYRRGSSVCQKKKEFTVGKDTVNSETSGSIHPEKKASNPIGTLQLIDLVRSCMNFHVCVRTACMQ